MLGDFMLMVQLPYKLQENAPKPLVQELVEPLA
jgi:hypothetical protein